MKDLDFVKKQLKNDLPSKGVNATIKALKTLLPQDSPKYNILLNLEAEQKALFIQSLKKILSEDQLQRSNTSIRDRLLSFIDSIDPQDFEKITDKSNFSQQQNYKKGHVLYQIPKRMQVLKETRCRVRIAFNEMMLIEDLELEDDIEIKSNLRVSDYMRVDIIDPSMQGAFEVRTTSDPVQFIDQDDFTEWRFYVKPLLPGEYTLELKVSLILLINGKEVKREKTLEENVVIISEEVPKSEIGFIKSKDEFITTQIPIKSNNNKIIARTASSKLSRGIVMGLLFLIISSSLSYALVPNFQESVNWFIADKVKSDLESYHSYIGKYESKTKKSAKIKRHIDLAYSKIQDLKFEEVIADSTSAKGLDYLAKFENGKHVDQVKSHLAAIAWKKILSLNDNENKTNQLKDFIEKFPNSKWTKVANDLLKELTEDNSSKIIINTEEKKVSSIKTPSVEVKREVEQEDLSPTIIENEVPMLDNNTIEATVDLTGKGSENNISENLKNDSLALVMENKIKKRIADSLALLEKLEQAKKDSIVLSKLNEKDNRFKGVSAVFKKSYFTDERDNTIYPIVLIGDKWWMAKNLSYKLNESYCFDLSERNCQRYGRLYTWRSAKRACPKGWRLPTDKEWSEMLKSIYGSNNDCKDCYVSLIQRGQSGFDSILAGRRLHNGRYTNMNEYGYYWTGTDITPKEAKIYLFIAKTQKLYQKTQPMRNGLSCRCIKD